ncbi:sister chromatid cohesion protein PDS5 homolog B-like isoform X2 [Mytilus californianus]|uniref:sister chromatid cohesion protein PDS5 homolog B-like isoform X2 n=1 Tax=Mytilus californianus TaxID=6549 RepID=UPI002245D346|nr:sister chromatid cohesion protein PDS5 homolog B-like isoform X2 [Mytilus californianus]
MSGKANKIVYPPGCKDITEEIGKEELVRRLKLLARAFQDMGQDDNDQYSGLAVYLATDYFLDHQSKDVRLLVACCIADVFRIFAPEAPYKDLKHLKDIFIFLVKQLRGLEDPDSPSFKRYFYLLENLAWVKSFNICIELEENQEIFCSLFQLMFSIVSDKHSSKVKNFVLDMLTPLITEADSVSQELMDIILLNVVEPYKTQKRVAYALAKELLIRSSNAIEPYIQAFFNNTLMLGKSSESELSHRLYDLIYELNQISPNVLLSVLPQLEFKLKSNEESERKQVTKLLAKMFSDEGSSLVEQNRPLWICFLGRFNDISIPVRQTCVQFSQYFLINHPETNKDIVEQLKSRSHDPEETIRMEVVNTVLSVAKKDFSIINEELLGFIKERTLDKKFQVRREALMGLGQLYKKYTFGEKVEESYVEKVSFIKDKIFHHYYQQSSDDRLLVERVFNTCLVPYNMPEEDRMRQFLLLYCTLDEHAIKAFQEMFKHRISVRAMILQMVEAIEQQALLNPRIVSLSRTLPETGKAIEHLKKFCQIIKDDKRLRSYLIKLLSQDCTCKKAQDLVREILKKLGGPSQGTQNIYYNTIKSLLERVAPVMIDVSAVDQLVSHVDDSVRGLGIITEGIDGAAEKSVKLLMVLSWTYPYYFKTEETYELLLTFMKHDDESVADLTLQIFNNIGKNLQKDYPNIYSSLLPVVSSAAKLGNPKQCKHAIRCINTICKNKEAIYGQIFEHYKKSLNPESANFITAIVGLGHIAKLCPEEFAPDIKTIVSKVIVKDLLMQDHTFGPSTTESWYSEHHVTEESMAKLQSMKLLTRWLQGLKSNANNSGTSTLRLLYTVIAHEGDLMEKGNINKPELARLRLQAGCCMIKLAEEKCFSDIITHEQFQALALLMNDSCYHVRHIFSLKLHKSLLTLRLPLQYMSIFCLAANDPMRERRTQIKQFLQNNITKRREYIKQNPSIQGRIFHFLPDYVMPYAIHLLAHDPELKEHDDVEPLKNIKECLWFNMEPLISKSEDYNYTFFRRMIENIKQTKDAQDPDDEETNMKLYAVCDVALGLLNSKSGNITLKDVTVEPRLSAKHFTKPDKSYSNTQNYLPKDFSFEGHKRKGVNALIDTSGKANTSKGQTTEIIVESPGPVVNPLPISPREQRQPKTKKTDVSSETESSPNSSADSVKKNDSGKNVDKKKPQKRKLNTDTKDENKEPKTAKVRNKKQTKTSGKNVPKSMDTEESDGDEDDDSSVANSESQESQEIPLGPKTKKAKNVSDKNSKSNVRTSKVDTLQKSKSLMNGAKTDSTVRTSDSPKPGSARKRKTESVSKESTPVKKSKLTTTITRSKLNRSDGESDESPPEDKTKKNVRKTASKQTRLDQFNVKSAPKNVRKGKNLPNGVSDGDSQETSSAASTPKSGTSIRIKTKVQTPDSTKKRGRPKKT